MKYSIVDDLDPVSFTVEISSLLLRHVRQQAEVVLLHRFLPTSVSNSHSTQCRFKTTSGGEKASKQGGDLPGHLRTSLVRAKVFTFKVARSSP